VLTSSLAATCGCRRGCEAPGAHEGRNVVLVTLDTTRRDRVGAYAEERDLTPNIDAVADRGVTFLDARTQIPITMPSHTCMMTGLELLEHGVRENGTFVLEDSALTVAEVLRERGYDTAAFVSSFVLDERFGIAQGFDVFDDDLGGGRRTSRRWQGHQVDHWERPADVTTRSAMDWLGERTSSDGAFFLWVHYYDPHEPWDPPEPYRSRYKLPYNGEIAFMDEQLGKLLDLLEDRGLEDDTLLILASDHGESVGEHGIRGHGWDIYEHAMRAVLIMRLPGVLPAGVRPARRVLLDAIAPTVMDVLGIEGSEIPGQSLRPLWDDGTPPPHPDPVYMETLLPVLRENRPEVLGVLDGKYKLITKPRIDRSWLYDVESDPGELRDLSAERPDVVKELERKLDEIVEEQDGEDLARTIEMDDETRKKLEALGYVSGS
jgi:arylsulfatase A-like enzyme